MVRFLLTADVQLGMRATDVPEVAAEVRQARFEALRRVVALAKEEAVAFVVVAGDLFQDNQVSAETAYQATAILAEAAPIPVHVLPGNHDPLCPCQPPVRPARVGWEHKLWAYPSTSTPDSSTGSVTAFRSHT